MNKVSIVHDERKKQKPWLVRYYGSLSEEGKAKRYCKSFRLKRNAEEFQASLQAKFGKGAARDRPKFIALGEFCGRYLDRRRGAWREKTRRHIEDLCERLLAFFGREILLDKLTGEMASIFLAAQRLLKGNAKGGELSRYTRNRLLRDSKTMFQFAVSWGFLGSNPFAGEKLLRVGRRASKKWHYLKPEEYPALLRAAPDLRWKVMYSLAYTSGARFGELFNLTEENIDFERGRLLIKNRPASDGLPPFHVKDHEDREIPLPRHTLRLLGGWLRVRERGSPLILLTARRFALVQRRWLEHRRKGKPWLNDFLVNNLLVTIRRHAKWAGIELRGILTLHAFRKSFAQRLADAGLPMNVVKELMGHASISTTAEFYSTVSAEQEQRAVEVFSTLGKATGCRLAADSVQTANRMENDAQLTPGGVLRPKRHVGWLSGLKTSLVTAKTYANSHRRDSNPQPAVYKTAALPIELQWRPRPGDSRGRLRVSASWLNRSDA